MSALDRALADVAAMTGPDTIALMRVLVEAPTEAEGRAALARAITAATEGVGRERLRRIEALWAAHPQAWQAVRGTIDGIAHVRPQGSTEQTLAYWAGAFDRLVAAEPEASVALYSLGSPALLAEATREIVDRMDAWSLVWPEAHVLDLGCGIGRFLIALAPRVARAAGRDVSPGMVAEARRRCSHLGNVNIAHTRGRDLADVPAASLDLVLAADVFPYLVEAGGGLAEHHVAEAARVLRPHGVLLVLNWSYRGDLAADRRDVAALAAAHHLGLERDGTHDFSLWDGATFLLRKHATG